MQRPHLSFVPLLPFLTRLINEHLVPRTVTDLVLQCELDTQEQREVGDPHLAAYAHGLADRLMQPCLDRLFRYETELKKNNEEITKLREDLKTEREALVGWIDMRINQQRPALESSYISPETQQTVRVEIGLLEKYREMVIAGGHRPDPDLLGHVLPER